MSGEAGTERDRPAVGHPDRLTLEQGETPPEPETAFAGHLRLPLIRQLVASLATIDPLAGEAERRMLRRSLQHLGGVDAATRPEVRLDLAIIVRACTESRGGLDDLLETVSTLVGDHPQMPHARRLCDELDGLGILPTDSQLVTIWESLREELRKMPLPQAEHEVHRVTGYRVGLLPQHCDTSWAAFTYLVGQNGRRQAMPPWMEWLELIRRDLSPPVNAAVRKALRELATVWRCVEELDRAVAVRDAETPVVLKDAVLTVVLTPDHNDSEHFTLHTVQRWNGEETPIERSEDVRVTRSELQARVEGRVSAAETRLGRRSSELHLEFVLPLALLNEPVELWPKDSSNPPSVSLATYHQVVVRSYDRLHNDRWHRVWMQRWERLTSNRPSRVLVLSEMGLEINEDSMRRLEASLRLDDECVGVVLTRPPNPRPGLPQEITVALRAGIPLIVWDRSDGASRAAEALTGLLDDVAKLPEAFAERRRQSQAQEPRELSEDPVQRTSVLYDDARAATLLLVRAD